MKRYRSKWYAFWKTLKQGYDDFELARVPPKVAVCSKQYLVNADFLGHDAKPDPAGTCPAIVRRRSTRSTRSDGQLMARDTTSAAPGPRLASFSTPPVTPAALSSAPRTAQPEPAASVVAARPDPAVPATSSPETPPAASGSAQSPQQTPTMSVSTGIEDPATKAEREALVQGEAPGLHNVAKSGKADMIFSAPAQK